MNDYIEILKDATRNGKIAIGALEVLRAIERSEALILFLANDIDNLDLFNPIVLAAENRHIPIIEITDKYAQGKIVGIKTKASIIAIKRYGRFVNYENLELKSLSATLAAQSIVKDISRIETCIKFRSKFIPKILSGEKSATLRIGKRIPISSIIPIIDISNNKIVVNVDITEVAWLQFGEVQHRVDILKNEYPHTFNEINDEMRVLYPGIKLETIVTYYKWELNDKK